MIKGLLSVVVFWLAVIGCSVLAINMPTAVLQFVLEIILVCGIVSVVLLASQIVYDICKG